MLYLWVFLSIWTTLCLGKRAVVDIKPCDNPSSCFIRHFEVLVPKPKKISVAGFTIVLKDINCTGIFLGNAQSKIFVRRKEKSNSWFFSGKLTDLGLACFLNFMYLDDANPEIGSSGSLAVSVYGRFSFLLLIFLFLFQMTIILRN